MKTDQNRVKLLISDTILMLCKNGLDFKSSLSIQGLVGITIDEEDVFIVHVNEIVKDVVFKIKENELSKPTEILKPIETEVNSNQEINNLNKKISLKQIDNNPLKENSCKKTSNLYNNSQDNHDYLLLDLTQDSVIKNEIEIIEDVVIVEDDFSFLNECKLVSNCHKNVPSNKLTQINNSCNEFYDRINVCSNQIKFSPLSDIEAKLNTLDKEASIIPNSPNYYQNSVFESEEHTHLNYLNSKKDCYTNNFSQSSVFSNRRLNSNVYSSNNHRNNVINNYYNRNLTTRSLSYACNSTLNRGSNWKTNGRLVCDVQGCQTTFSNRQNLLRHQTNKHGRFKQSRRPRMFPNDYSSIRIKNNDFVDGEEEWINKIGNSEEESQTES